MLTHDKIEKNVLIMGVLIFLLVSVAGLVQLVPMIVNAVKIDPIPGMKPLTALQLTGRDIYIREGCYGCHSQQVRPFVDEVMRYGPPSVAGEFVYDHPFQFGSRRAGPDLAREGGINSDQWHRDHLINPRQFVPTSNMPSYAFLATAKIDDGNIEAKMNALKLLGVPYDMPEMPAIKDAKSQIAGKSEMDALIAYLQSLGTAVGVNQANLTGGAK